MGISSFGRAPDRQLNPGPEMTLTMRFDPEPLPEYWCELHFETTGGSMEDFGEVSKGTIRFKEVGGQWGEWTDIGRWKLELDADNLKMRMKLIHDGST